MIRAHKTIRSWADMREFGFDALTGEACALSYRGLFDLTAQGLKIVQTVIGAVELKAPSDYNGGDASLLMPYVMLEPLAVFALLDIGCQYVAIVHEVDTYSGLIIMGFDSSYTRDELDAALTEYAGSRYFRILSYPTQRPGITVGLSNVHQVLGRIS